MTRSRLALLVAGALLAAHSPAAAAPFRGKVVLDGKPVAGATVVAVPEEEPLAAARRKARGEPEPGPIATVTTSATGDFALEVPAPQGRDVVFRVRVSAAGAVPAEVPESRDAAEPDDLGDLVLRKAEPLAGRVQGPDGAPVAGALVRLFARGRPAASGSLATLPQETTTGADGQFRFATAAAEQNDVYVEAAGFAPARATGLKGGAMPRGVSLSPGAALSGTVKRKDGRPAPGALVRFEADGLESRWVEAGEDGRFRLADLPKRRGVVVADGGDDGFGELAGTTPGSAAAVALVLAPPSILEGRTLDASTLKPVPRVRLQASAGGERLTARSGADGRYRFRGLRPGSAWVRADEPRHVLWMRGQVPVEKGATRTLDVLLTRGATLSGRVVDEDGRPVADATVAVLSSSESPVDAIVRSRTGPGSRLRSRADGTFTATRLLPGENQRLTVQHPEFEKATVGGISLVAGGTRTGVAVTLRRGLVLTGTVKDPEGNPIAGAELSTSRSRVVRSSDGNRLTQVRFGPGDEAPPARSGPDGSFEIRGVAPGDVALTAKAPGRATETVDPIRLVRDARPDPVDLVLGPGASISGSILRRTGGGAAGYLVSVQVPGRPAAGMVSPMNPAGPDGAFELDGLRAGETYDLQLWGGGGFAIGPGPTKRGIVAPATGVEWVVEGTGRIEGTAVDGKTGQAPGAFEVSYHQDGPGMGDFFRVGRGTGRFTGGVGETFPFEAPDGRFALEDVPAGKWQVVVTAKGYQAGRASGVVVEEGTTTEGVDLRLAPESLLRGVVKDARTGRGVPDARVLARGETGPATSLPGSGGIYTDLDGRFEAEGLAPGKVTVSAAHSDYTTRTETTVLQEGGGSVEIALSHGSAVSGVVLSETRQPVPGAGVTIEGGVARPGSFGGGDETAADGAGRFRFERLSAGRYTLRASVPGQSSEPVEAVVVEGEPSRELTLVLSGGATLRGSVSGLPEALRGHVSVNANGPRDYWATVKAGADGRFELAGVPVGTIRVRASAGDFLSGTMRSAGSTVVVEEGQKEAETEIVFEGNGALSGRVTRGGRPLADARVIVGSQRSGRSASGRTDDTGAYRIEGLTPGDYDAIVQADTAGMRPGVSRTVKVDGETRLDVDLPLASLFGVVVDASTKRPLSDVRLVASVDDGPSSRPGNATSDSNGRFFFEDLEEGAHTLTLRRTGYRETRATARAAEGGGDAGSIEMARGDGLEIRVRDGIYGIPLRGVGVRVRDGAGTVVASASVALDGDGKGEIASLRPGQFSIDFGAGRYATRTYEGVLVPGPPLEASLTPGGAVEVRSGPASREKGLATLLDALGRPHPIRLGVTDGRLTLTAGGIDLVENLAPGSYTLAVEGMEPKAFTVTEGGKTVVVLP